MVRLLLLGILSGAFFSTTFLLNEAMSLGGGHWVWSASLRYGFMVLFLVAVLWFKGGAALLKGTWALFLAHWRFWVLAGGVGFGGFYALICFSAKSAPGWVIASTWQFTVVASLFVLMLFGQRFPKRVWFFSALVFVGVLLVNLSHTQSITAQTLLLGALPVFIAAFCYPFGNQLVWEASRGKHAHLPHISSPLLANAFVKVLVMSMGSFPLWAVLILSVQPPMPSGAQVFQTALVALFSGVVATSIFLFARSLAHTPSELAGVDASQSSQVVFALLGGMVFLDSPLPSMVAFAGLGLIGLGLFCFLFFRQKVV
ncbi:multidrug resistance efflux transporter family protein [Sulfurospirillum sp. T05]|uniref:Multidrug resistance efflux transporter family protein n=1 Tax=Sulfurospirillum tamanense TaxID=2813362 RepID=A0ABS2WRK0_9BACT|nr:multidrug resistance efflux transporter family protein [Sulfurospirillum tamanensis]MBN2964301.1 multidrug resistance efflux transporter family protein [Sulfurospirillum tamanensis]